MTGEMVLTRLPVRMMLLFALSLLVVGCGSGSPTVDLQSSSQSSPLPTEIVAPSVVDFQSSPLPTEIVAPTVVDLQSSPLPTETAAPTLTPESDQLVILHTNDNWGETEPCG